MVEIKIRILKHCIIGFERKGWDVCHKSKQFVDTDRAKSIKENSSFLNLWRLKFKLLREFV